jgi:ketosteroid isomerase-like protein
MITSLILLTIFFGNKLSQFKIRHSLLHKTYLSAISKEETRTENDKTLVTLISQTKDKQYGSKSQKLHANSGLFRKTIIGSSIGIVKTHLSPGKQESPYEREGQHVLLAADGVSQASDVNRSEEVRVFIILYILAYEKGDIDGFMNFYSKAAIENNMMNYEDIRNAYQKNFSRAIYKYGMSNVQLQKTGDDIIVTSQYMVHRINDSKATPIQGNMRWVLSREDGALKIVKADYDRK